MRDPRNSRKYADLRRDYIARADPICDLCGGWIDTTLPGTHRLGPTIEHRVPIRDVLAYCQTQAEVNAMALDTQTWALAHAKCNQLQGASAGGTIITTRNAQRRRGSRDW